LTVDESGVPFQRRYYVKLYGELAAAAGVPRTVWNMRARHGGVSEAVDAGVSNLDLGKHAQHSSIQTTFRHYVVPTIETSRRVAKRASRIARKRKARENGVRITISNRISNTFPTNMPIGALGEIRTPDPQIRRVATTPRERAWAATTPVKP
jgi:hypothetical protein